LLAVAAGGVQTAVALAAALAGIVRLFLENYLVEVVPQNLH
jgi:hypothetical protein